MFLHELSCFFMINCIIHVSTLQAYGLQQCTLWQPNNKFGFSPKICAGEFQGLDLGTYVVDKEFNDPQDDYSAGATNTIYTGKDYPSGTIQLLIIGTIYVYRRNMAE